MADTNALRTIESVVTDFLLGYKKTTEDYIIYLKHACDAVREFNLYHGGEFKMEKMTVDSNKFLEMPDDMIGFNDLLIPFNGEWWSFSERRKIVNTTTFTGLVEGRDDESGEGVEIKHSLTYGYGAHGGVNNYNYMIDWRARRIFLDGIDSGTVVLRYVSSGINLTADTYVSELIVPVIQSYLLWKETYFVKGLERERLLREKDYDKEVLKVRNFTNSMTYDQLRDLILSSTTPTPRR